MCQVCTEQRYSIRRLSKLAICATNMCYFSEPNFTFHPLGKHTSRLSSICNNSTTIITPLQLPLMIPLSYFSEMEFFFLIYYAYIWRASISYHYILYLLQHLLGKIILYVSIFIPSNHSHFVSSSFKYL